MANKYTHFDVSLESPYPPYGVILTGYTDDAWNRRYPGSIDTADLEWVKAHPYLARARDAGINIINGLNNAVDAVTLNENNIRVRNAQLHPEAMRAVNTGGNIAALSLLGPIATVPAAAETLIYGPLAVKLLTKSGSNTLAARGGESVAASTFVKELLPWLTGGLATLLTGLHLYLDDTPSFNIDFMSDDTAEEAAENADTNVVDDYDYAIEESELTPPPQLNPEDPNNQGNKRSLRERAGDWVGNKIAGRKPTNLRGTLGANQRANNPQNAPKKRRSLLEWWLDGYRNGTPTSNFLRGIRDYLIGMTGVDLIDNAAGAIGEMVDSTRVSDANFNFTKNLTPVGWILKGATKPKPAENKQEADTTRNLDNVLLVVDTVQGVQVNPDTVKSSQGTGSLYNKQSKDLEQMLGGFSINNNDSTTNL